MTAVTTASRHLHQPLSHLRAQPLSIAPTIKSLLQSLNPQNPKNHQNPDPSILDQFSPYLTNELVVEIIGDQTSPYHSLFFFNWASTLIPKHSLSRFCYIAITDKLLSHKLFSSAADLLKFHGKFSDFMVGKFIKAHGDLGHLKWSVKLFNRVKMNELGDCLFCFNSLLGVLVKANRCGLAWGYFGQIVFKSSVVVPDVSTYNTMIGGLCKAGMIEDAHKLFDEMCCGKNSITYSVFVDGLCKKGFVERAQRIVDLMVDDESCSPCPVSYTTLMDGYCKKGQLGNAVRCFEEMVSRGISEPNVLTFNVLINAMCMKGYVEEARMMMSRMKMRGVRENIVTHTSLLKGYCIARRSHEAINHFKEMVNLDIVIDGKSCSVIVNEFCKLGRPDEAIEVFKKMIAMGITPSLANFNGVLRSLIRLQEFDKAVLLLKQMARWGCCPNFISYREVIIGLVCAKGRMQDVEMVVHDMIQGGHVLDATLYSSLIRAYCVNGDVRRAVGLFKEMIGKSLVIKTRCFEAFVEEMCGRGLVHEVESLFYQMENSCPVLDVETYQSILRKCVLNSIVKSAWPTSIQTLLESDGIFDPTP